jgi:hypothetical protein
VIVHIAAKLRELLLHDEVDDVAEVAALLLEGQVESLRAEAAVTIKMERSIALDVGTKLRPCWRASTIGSLKGCHSSRFPTKWVSLRSASTSYCELCALASRS